MTTANLGQANVAIRATLDKLDGDLSQARGRVNTAVGKMARGAGKSFRDLGAAALGGIGVATAAAAGLAATLAKITIEAAPIQGVSDAFDGLAESAGFGADEMVGALKRGSAGMVSQRDLMLSFNKAAQLVSTDFATQLPDAMQYLGKVSAATGQDMGYLLDSLVVGVGRVSPMILDNLGIQVAAAEATARAAQMFGVEAEALDKTQIQAGMMNVVLEKLAANTAAMPDATQSAAAKMAQFTAGLQDAKDAVGLALLPVLGELLSGALPLLQSALPLAATAAGNLALALGPVVAAISSLVQRVLAGTAPLDAFKVLLMELLPPEMFGAAMQLVDGIAQIIEQAQAAREPVAAWLSENVALQDVLLALGVAMATVVVPIIASVVTAIAPVIAIFIVAVAVAAALRAAWESNFLGIRDVAASVWGWLQIYIPQALETIQAIFNTVVAAIAAYWAANGAEIMAKATEIWEGVVGIFEWFVGQWMLLYEAFALAFSGDWRGFGEKIRELWDEAWIQISRIGAAAWGKIKAFFAETDWGAVGTAILQGIASGITSGLSIIADAAKNAAKAALDAAKGFLGIHSPARVPAAEIGEPFTEGIGGGIERALPRLRRAAQAAVATLMEATQRPQWSEAGGAGVGNGSGGQQIIIYGLTLEGVQDRRGLLAELQALV